MNSSLTQSTLLTAEKIFKDSFFRVPDYQRGYSWQQLQREELLEDIELLPENKPHYTGTLVLYSSNGTGKIIDKQGDSYELLDIVDGQQRLTTIVVLLDVVRRNLEELGENDLAKGLKERYIAVEDCNRVLMPKLTLNKDCHKFFIDVMLDVEGSLAGPTIRSHKNLQDAWEQFRDYLKKKKSELGEKFASWLISFRNKICQHLVFTVYTVQEAIDVGIIFEVMNNRGLKITELEKVKNYLLYLSSKLELRPDHDLGGLINTTWTHILESLMASKLGSTDNEDQLLRMHWLMGYDYETKKWKGSKSIKNEFHLRDYISRHEELLGDLKEYINTLRDTTTAYCDICNPLHTNSFNNLSSNPELRKQIVNISEKLRRLKVLAPFIPILMAVRLRFPQNAGAYLQILELCEKYSFRVYTFLERRANAGRSSLYLTANAFYNKQCDFDKVSQMLLGLIHRYSPNEKFLRKFDLVEESNWYSWKGIKYFLYEYEEYLSQGATVRIPWEKLEDPKSKQNTIEHILPQTPPPGYWLEHFNQEQLAKYTHDIGNLSLTFDNSSYGTKAFPDKKGSPDSDKQCYMKSCLFMEKSLAQFDKWSEEEVIERRSDIIEWAKNKWGVPKPKAESELYTESMEDADDEPDVKLVEEELASPP